MISDIESQNQKTRINKTSKTAKIWNLLVFTWEIQNTKAEQQDRVVMLEGLVRIISKRPAAWMLKLTFYLIITEKEIQTHYH